MPAVEYERPLRLRATPSPSSTSSPVAPLDFKRPPRHRNSDLPQPPASAPSLSLSSSSTSAGISIMKPVKQAALTSSSSSSSSSLSSSSSRRKPSYDFVADPFEKHLEDIYAGNVTSDDGLGFFESHGYFDVSEANTVAMFRQNFGLKKFWDGGDHDIVFYEEMNLDTVDLAGLQVLNAGAMLSKPVKRHRTMSGRFQLLDDEGNVVDAETQLEAEREKRLKLRHLELDDDDRDALAKEQLTLAVAITVIRTEKTRFKRYFYEACNDEMTRTTSFVIPTPTPPPTPVLEPSPLPSYAGYLYVLKDSIPHLFRSWHKRWVYLDINTGMANMYKRNYWKSARGSLDMRTVCNITRMNQSDVCLQCTDGRTMLFRTKSGTADADMWMNVLQVARRQVSGGALASSALPAAMTQLTTTTTKTLTTVTTSSNSILVSAKLGSPMPSEKTVLEMLMQAKITSSQQTITAA